jgi:hypothetical protein
MKIQLYILIGLLLLAILINLGCKTAAPTFTPLPIPHEDYNEEKVFVEAERFGLRPVDYLHYANNPNAVQPSFKIFGLHLIPEGTAREQLSALDEFQARPCLTPPCNCGRGGNGWRGFKGRLKCLPFRGAMEASNHQERLEAIVEIEDSYKGRVADYRYEVRIVNPSTNEVLHTTNEYNAAYEYVVDYSSAHSDLIIYDLKTGEFFEETP